MFKSMIPKVHQVQYVRSVKTSRPRSDSQPSTEIRSSTWYLRSIKYNTWGLWRHQDQDPTANHQPRSGVRPAAIYSELTHFSRDRHRGSQPEEVDRNGPREHATSIYKRKVSYFWIHHRCICVVSEHDHGRCGREFTDRSRYCQLIGTTETGESNLWPLHISMRWINWFLAYKIL